MCWNRDAFRDAALLVSGEEGAQAFFVLFAYRTNQTAMFSPLRRFWGALPALTRVSGIEAPNDEITFGENDHIQVVAGPSSLNNWWSWQLTSSR